jgi:aldehyde dehydrogenase (NAD+)/phenylacetaldehyde dehydrogenase
MIALPKNVTLHPETIKFLDEEKKLFINGEWISPSSGEYFQTINPANDNVLSDIPVADYQDVDRAVEAALKAFATVWRQKITPAQRDGLLWKFAALLERDKQILMELETLDNGKPLEKAEYDVNGAINHFKYYAGWATKIEGNTIPVDSEKLVFTTKEPLGVVGLIVPWNFPLMIASWKLAPALACGNCCILKPAEQTPLTAMYLGKLFNEAGFPKGVVNILTGAGLPTGEAITSHNDISKVSFTGSTAVGRKIMEAASKSNLKKVSLELGGKSPNVVFDDADLKSVMDVVHWTSFYNTGQECTLGSRLYLQESIFNEVLDNLVAKAEKLTIGNGLTNPDLGPMISEKQLNTVLEYVDSGKSSNAELICGGTRCAEDLTDGYFLTPTVFSHQNDQLDIVKEEIFGPVVVVSKFKDFDEIVFRANDNKYGLAAAVWTNNIKKAHRFANAVNAGTVWINGYDMFSPAAPFGGFKESGMGKEMGKSAIDLYTQEKTIWVSLL